MTWQFEPTSSVYIGYTTAFRSKVNVGTCCPRPDWIYTGPMPLADAVLHQIFCGRESHQLCLMSLRLRHSDDLRLHSIKLQ